MGEIRALGLFTYSCLVAAITVALPAWLILFVVLGIAAKFWRNVRVPPVLLYSLIVLAFSYLVWESPRFWHRNTAAGAFTIATLFYVLSPPHKYRILRFHAGLFSLLVAVLIIPRETYPLPIYLFLTLLVCVSLVFHHAPLQNTLGLMALGKTIARLALPLSLLMVPVYYFFPEIQAPRPKSGNSGIANEMEPGRIASLALSDRLAFRVKFLTEIPERNQLYWRTDVFQRSEGLRWTPGASESPETFSYSEPTESVRYEIMLDSQLNGLVPSLEQTKSVTTHEEQQATQTPTINTFRSLASFFVVGAEPADSFPAEKPKLSYVEPSTPRVMALVAELKGMSIPNQIDSLLRRFQTYQYTLNPGVLESESPLDEFLFDTRKGYCEHFAGSFATLLRLAGTPARVVVGFVGGTRLGRSSYFQVTSRSAHAWTEVWYDGAWHRVDPSSYAQGGSEIGMGSTGTASYIITWITFQAEHFAIWFKNWAEDIGLLWIGCGFLGVGLLSLQIYRVTHRKHVLPKWEKAMNRFLHRLENRGYPRQPAETVAHYLERIDPELRRLAVLYNERKFGEDETKTDELKNEIRAGLRSIGKYPRLKNQN